MSFMQWAAVIILAVIASFGLAILIGKFLKSRTKNLH
jgi:hypothetical protein